MASPFPVAELIKHMMQPVEEAILIEQAKAELLALGEKYAGGDIPTKELFRFMDIPGLLEPEMCRNLKYVSIGNGDLTEEELTDLEKEGINNYNLFVDPRGWTPICRAIRQDDESMIDRILAHPDFDPNIRNQDELHPATPLMIAAEHRPRYLEKILASPNIDADLMDIYQCSSLAIVIQYNPGFLPVMLASNRVNVNLKNCKDGSALVFAVQMASPVELTLLLENGASVEGFDGTAPILVALMTRNYAALPVLSKYGARLPIKFLKNQVEQGSIKLEEAAEHLVSAELFTYAELNSEFTWAS